MQSRFPLQRKSSWAPLFLRGKLWQDPDFFPSEALLPNTSLHAKCTERPNNNKMLQFGEEKGLL